MMQYGKEISRFVPNERAALVRGAFTAYGLLKSHGILPVSGGWLDQSAAFVSAVEVIDGAIADGRS